MLQGKKKNITILVIGILNLVLTLGAMFSMDKRLPLNVFKDFVLENLNNNTPIMVEWIDWGGHWSNIIGYDTMGTESPADDVLILADPYDTSDHSQDGYKIYSGPRFFYMWLDSGMLPEDQSIQQWLVAKPGK